MVRRKRVNQNKRNNGGTGTAVGNLLRKVTDPIKNATGRSTIPVQTASVNNFKIRTVPGDPSQVIPNGSIISRETQKQADKGKLSPVQMGNIYSSPAPRVNNASYDPLSTRDRINQNIAGGGNPLGPNIPEDLSSRLQANTEDGGEVDAQGRSMESGVTIPSKKYNSYGGGANTTPTSPSTPTAPKAEFSKGGVSNFKSTTPTGGGLSTALGQLGGGVRGGGIPGTAIEDDYYANLLGQLEKDSQDNVDLKDIRRKNEQRAQAEINSINAIYSDLVGRAQRTGEESMGSERAVQARSGTLASSFGQGALQSQAENTDKNIGEIENQRASTIADVYARSNESALNEYQTMKQLKAQDFETYQAVQAQEKSILENGLNDVAEYMALQGLSAEDLDMDGLKKIAKDWKSTPQKVYNSIMAKQAELQQRDLDQSEQRGEFDKTKATTGGADNFGDFSDEAIAFSVLPTQLKNSDKEKEYFLEGIRQGLSEGLTPYEIADNLLGYKVTAPDQFSENIRPLIGESELAPQTIAQVAREINKGNRVKAIELIENSIMGRAKKETDSFVSESMTRTAFDRSSDLITKIGESGKSPVGVVKGSMENWLGKLRGKEASKIKADIIRQVAQMRKEFSGSAVTPSEERFLAPIIPDLNDKPDVFMYKLQALGSEPIRQLNNIRQQYGLVQLDGESLKNKNLRVEDYYGMQSNAPQNTQSTSNSGGGGNWDW